MLFKISWRNIWRSRTRSAVVISSIAVGVWALSFVLSFSNGLIYTFIQNAIRDQYSHIQIHHPKFPEDKNNKHYIENADSILSSIKQIPEIEAATSRVITTGMLSTSHGARGVQVMGVRAKSESSVTKFNQKIVEGSYFIAGKKNQIIISRRLAEKLKVKLRSRMVLTFQDTKGEITAAAFRIGGLYSSGNMIIDESLVYVNDKDLAKSIIIVESNNNNLDVAHEFAIYLKDSDNTALIKDKLKKQYPELLIEDYYDLSPDVELYETQINTSNSIIIIIFMLALIFGIINTMLMAVLERYRELGMLMAIGMNKAKIFFMIVLETFLLSAVAAPIGLGIGILTVYLLQDKGIDLSAFSKGLERFGMETTIYPAMDIELYVQISIAVFITALLASIYPARKAVKLQPVEALHKI